MTPYERRYPIEHVRQEIRRNASAVSATDTDTCRSSRVPLIRPPAGVNLIALLNRFPHDLLQATGVATDETLWRLLNRKLNVLGRGGCPHRVCRLSHPIAQVDGFQLKQKDVDYFDAISEQQENGGTEAMLHELLDRDISEFNPMEFPDTPALNEQKQLLLLPQRHGCETCCWTPRSTVGSRGRTKRPSTRATSTLCNTLVRLVAYPLNKSEPTRYLHRLGVGQFRAHGGKRQYPFGDLKSVRGAFDQVHDIKTKWSRKKSV
jgi:hypothetical protein